MLCLEKTFGTPHRMEKKINYQQMIADCGKPEAVAQEIKVHFTSVYRWIRGERVPSVRVIERLITAYDIDINDYIDTGVTNGTQGEDTTSSL